MAVPEYTFRQQGFKNLFHALPVFITALAVLLRSVSSWRGTHLAG